MTCVDPVFLLLFFSTKDELFVNTNAMIPAWLTQNEYVTKTYVDAEIGRHTHNDRCRHISAPWFQ